MRLVRDRIPELAAGTSQPGAFSQVTGTEFGRLLRAKLLEEAAEAAGAPGPAGLLEELGDVLQVLYALATRPATARPRSSAPAPARPALTASTPAASSGSPPPGRLPHSHPRRFLCVSTPPAFT
jgi:predicted house-cleaning noncanonical NTP pyrophosphatase (MazG superfamily)